MSRSQPPSGSARSGRDERVGAACRLLDEVFPAPDGASPPADVDGLLARVHQLCAERRLPRGADDALRTATDQLLCMSALDFSCPTPKRSGDATVDRLTDAIALLGAELERSAVSASHVADLLGSLTQPVLLLDRGGVVTDVNPAARALVGADAVDQPLDALLREPVLLAEQLARARDGADRPPLSVQLRVGTERHLLLSISALRSNFDDVEGFACVGTDITEQVQTQEALARAKELAESHARARAAFLARISHEIRTPLSGVIGMAALLQESTLSIEQRELAADLVASGNHLVELVNEVLDFAMIDSERLVLADEDVELRRLVRRCASMIRDAAEAKGIALACAVAPSCPQVVRGDRLRLRQILLNLLSNAIKFTERGRVTLDVTPVRGDGPGDGDDDGPGSGDAVTLRFEVTDTGRWFSEATKQLLFEPFFQAERGGPGGVGLGLAIARRVVEQMGGRLDCVSEPGRGSRFWFEVSLARVDERARLSASARLRASALDSRDVALDGVELRGRRVLLVEDNPVNQKVVSAILRRLGVAVDVAQHGQEAVAMYEPGHHEVVLMDCQMPIMDGFEATRALRDRPGGPRVPIIALTAHAFAEERAQCMAVGMDDFLPKPIRPDDLARLLRKWISASEEAG